jgi:16S rRNA (guanine(966)-N(2))-methyltransferase RsmD
MRIISGKFRGKRIHPPANIPARPTTDFAKVALFNILNNHFDFEDIRYLDLFSGTGCISYEMFSRGCTQITMVDLSPISVNFQKKTAEEIKMDANIMRGDALQFITSCRQTFDVIFAGPPYALEQIDDIPYMVMNHPSLLAEDGWFILETSPKHSFIDHPNLLEVRNYGQTHFWIFGHNTDEA